MQNKPMQSGHMNSMVGNYSMAFPDSQKYYAVKHQIDLSLIVSSNFRIKYYLISQLQTPFTELQHKHLRSTTVAHIYYSTRPIIYKE